MKTCYVSIPYGVKDGIDFEWIYREIVLPAVLDAGLACQRGDELGGVALIQKAILQAVISSDVVIADVSIQNPNVMYEVGIRHALRRGVTILIGSDAAVLPFHLRNCFVVRYGTGDFPISSENALAMRTRVAAAIQNRLTRVVNDSPIFEYFIGLHVELPEGLPGDELRYTYPPGLKTRPRRGDTKTDVARAEEQTRGTANVDPHAYLDIFSRYRAISAWEEIIRLAETLPAEVVNSPQVVQTVALAFSRLNQPDRAIELLQKYTRETGGDAESDGLFGSMYKKRYFAEHRSEDLHEAIQHYRRGFERDRQNLYLGLSMAILLQRSGPFSAAELGRLLPELRTLAAAKTDSSPTPDYWDLECSMLLSVIARDWTTAGQMMDRMVSLSPASWLLEGSRSELKGMADVVSKADVGRLDELLHRMEELVASAEEDDA